MGSWLGAGDGSVTEVGEHLPHVHGGDQFRGKKDQGPYIQYPEILYLELQ